MKSQRASRDVALTTVIDLLVQVVFVFTLILLASGAIEGTAEQRGYISGEDWKTLVSIFDVDVKKNAREQAIQIREKYDQLVKERDELARQSKKLRENIAELDRRLTDLENKRLGGAPGYPPCRATDGSELVVGNASIDSAGRVSLAFTASAHEEYPRGGRQLERPITRTEFSADFAPWLDQGMSRKPQCKFTVFVRYDPDARAGDYQPTVAAISTIFRARISQR